MLPPTPARAFALLAALDALAAPALAADATSTVAAGVPIPSTSDFIMRRRHSLVTLGDFAYLDGGWLWQYVLNSTSKTSVVERSPNNYTISIDLRSSWSNSSSATDIMRSIEKPAETPRFEHPTLWRDDARGVVYLWGGTTMYGDAPGRALWKFTPDGKGGGEWATVDGVENDGTFASLTRTFNGFVAVTGGAGFVVSGVTSAASDPNGDETATGQTSVPGVVGYNFTSGAWSNGTTAANFTAGSTAWLGGAVGVDIFANPMVVALGGESGTLTSMNQPFLDFDSVRIYSPKEDRWYTQGTTGDTPPSRYAFCMTGTHSKNGTFEIFVYGGWDGAQNDIARGDTWVLSLPGFHWFKGEEAAVHTTRACDVVGKGRRQVLVVGGPGQEFENQQVLQDKPPDVWANGLGVFDLSTLTWSDRFDADADEYDAPDVVKEWYNQGNGADWDSEDTKQLFSRTVVATTTTSGGGGTTMSSEDGGSGNNKTRLIGGLVGGILGGILAVCVAGLVFWRRRRRQENEANSDKELDLRGGNNGDDKLGSLHRSDLELEAREKPREMESPWVSSAPAELPAPVAELDGMPKETQKFFPEETGRDYEGAQTQRKLT